MLAITFRTEFTLIGAAAIAADRTGPCTGSGLVFRGVCRRKSRWSLHIRSDATDVVLQQVHGGIGP